VGAGAPGAVSTLSTARPASEKGGCSGVQMRCTASQTPVAGQMGTVPDDASPVQENVMTMLFETPSCAIASATVPAARKIAQG
jgi:hypothetical protein